MSDYGKKYVKFKCDKSKCYGLATIESENGRELITNFYEIDDATAKNIPSDFSGALPAVSPHLKPCAATGTRTAISVDKKSQCRVKKGELWYQCIYCKNLTVCKDQTGMDIYFLLDESGSMSSSDREEAAQAVRNIVQSLQGSGNTYSFVPWASSARYLFERETDLSKMQSALDTYKNGASGVGGSTAADRAFECVKANVLSADKPVRIIFVTDGGFDNDEAAERARNALLANKSVEILAIGITGAVESALRRVGTVPSFSKVVGGSAALGKTAGEIAEFLRKSGQNV